MADLSFPLLPTRAVLVPHGTMALRVKGAEAIQLIYDCARSKRPLVVAQKGASGLAPMGCVARIESVVRDGATLRCQVRGVARLSVRGTLSYKDLPDAPPPKATTGTPITSVATSSPPVPDPPPEVYGLDSLPDVPYPFAYGPLIEDDPDADDPNVLDRLEEELLGLLLHNQTPEQQEVIRDVFEDDMQARSFWVLDILVPDHTPKGILHRLQFLAATSETTRLRRLLALLQQN